MHTQPLVQCPPRQRGAEAPPGTPLRLHVLRYNPAQPEIAPRLQVYPMEAADGLTLFIALNEIREQQDPSLNFDFVCRAGVCGACAMLINGRPRLACRTLLADLARESGPDITLAPLPGFELIADLAVNTGKWMRALTERLQAWVQANEAADLDRIEAPMDPDLAERIYELDRCIECGCCFAACGTGQMRPEFVGAVGLAKIARLHLDPRDTRSDAALYELVGHDEGVFGCMTLLACHDMCPKQLPLQAQIAYVRRKMAAAGLSI
jgi:fumarate reductase iron-sulfur subunit